MDNISAGTTPVRSTKLCVVFDTRSGKVRHVHQVVTLEGGREPSQRDIEEQALTLAAQRGVDRKKVEALHVAPETLNPMMRYKVDAKKRVLVAEKAQTKPRSKSPAKRKVKTRKKR